MSAQRGGGLLVGYGSIGRRHLTNLHSLGVDDWAVVHTGRGTLPFEPPCAVRTYPTLADALAVEEPAFAVVANPTALHLATAMACAERGSHLLVEKPIASSVEGLDELRDVVERHGVRVLVGFQFRLHPALAEIRRLLDEDAVGTVRRVHVSWGEYLPDWHPWEDWHQGYAARPELGGGVHHTICHPFDYLRMLLGDVVAVRAHLSDAHPLRLEVPEALDAQLELGSGVTATVHLDYWSRPQDHRLEIRGDEGTITWDYLSGALGVWRIDRPEWTVRDVGGVAARDDLFLALASHFLRVVDGKEQPACTVDDGVSAVRVVDAIERSSARDGATVIVASP